MGVNHLRCHPGLQRRAWLPLSGPQTPGPAHADLEGHRQLPKLKTPLADTRGARLSYWQYHQWAPGPASADLEGHRHSSHWELHQRARDLPRLSREGTDSSQTRGPARKSQNLPVWTQKSREIQPLAVPPGALGLTLLTWVKSVASFQNENFHRQVTGSTPAGLEGHKQLYLPGILLGVGGTGSAPDDPEGHGPATGIPPAGPTTCPGVL